eukprot:TRINITY_DN2041_c0_g1_i1.p1 TRINITY_DN2041_c0_g1~~TRINITY_DN2041_c0_g1_i1.p1  ORF type:complete len:720 (-),score=189.05 TRINITY_DN2041_c0_g1_i1:12-2171(-)
MTESEPLEWKKELRNSSRGVLVTIDNTTDYAFTRSKFSITYGIWKEEPPEKIEPHSQVEFGTSSNGFVSGTEASVHYRIDTPDEEPQSTKKEDIRFYWNNPFIGIKSHTSSSPSSCIVESSSSSLSSLASQLYYVVYNIVDIDRSELDSDTSTSLQPSGTYQIVKSPTLEAEEKSIKDQAEMKLTEASKRSVRIVIHNNTSKTLTRKVYTLTHGKWVGFPPEAIEPATRKEFSSESDIIATATSGIIFYEICENGKSVVEFEFFWSNSFVGETEFKSQVISSVPNGPYSIEEHTELGNEAMATFSIRDQRTRSRSRRAIELSTSKEIFPDCYLCGRVFDDKKRYCVDCFRGIIEENRTVISKKMHALRLAKEENRKLADEAAVQIEKMQELRRLKILRDNAARKVEHLKAKISLVREGSKRERDIILEKSPRYEKTKGDLSNAFLRIRQIAGDLDRRFGNYGKKKQEDIDKIYDKLSKHRKYLIVELLSFFPLNPVTENEYAIVNIKLPQAYLNWIGLPLEAVATACGYVVHLLSVATVYLDVCLPYKMLFSGSRSLIWRDGSRYEKKEAQDKRYLLYKEDEEDFRIALDMLNWNVVHFCLSQGIMISQDKQEFTLANLLHALRSPLLGLPGPHYDNAEIAENRGRTYSLSLAHLSANRGQGATPLIQPAGEQAPDRPRPVKRGSKDEDDFVIIDSFVPTPSSDKDLHDFERAMFLDKI